MEEFKGYAKRKKWAKVTPQYQEIPKNQTEVNVQAI